MMDFISFLLTEPATSKTAAQFLQEQKEVRENSPYPISSGTSNYFKQAFAVAGVYDLICNNGDRTSAKQVIVDTMSMSRLADITVEIKTLTGKTYPIDINLFSTLHNLKQELERESGVSPEQQIIVFRGKKYDDNIRLLDTLARDIDGRRAHLVLALRSEHKSEHKTDNAPLPSAAASTTTTSTTTAPVTSTTKPKPVYSPVRPPADSSSAPPKSTSSVAATTSTSTSTSSSTHTTPKPKKSGWNLFGGSKSPADTQSRPPQPRSHAKKTEERKPPGPGRGGPSTT